MWLSANRIYDTSEPEHAELKKYAPLEIDWDSLWYNSNITLSYTIAYWRKANAIHGWFMANCANDVDESLQIPIPVFRSDLVKLNNLCKSVMNDPSTAAKALPPNRLISRYNNIDIYYFLHIKDTISILDNILEIIPDDNDKWNFVYQASW